MVKVKNVGHSDTMLHLLYIMLWFQVGLVQKKCSQCIIYKYSKTSWAATPTMHRSVIGYDRVAVQNRHQSVLIADFAEEVLDILVVVLHVLTQYHVLSYKYSGWS